MNNRPLVVVYTNDKGQIVGLHAPGCEIAIKPYIEQYLVNESVVMPTSRLLVKKPGWKVKEEQAVQEFINNPL